MMTSEELWVAARLGSAGGALSTAGETPARKFEEAGSTVSGLPSPLVSTLTPCL